MPIYAIELRLLERFRPDSFKTERLVCVRCNLGNYKSCSTGIRYVGSRDSCAAQVCFVSVPHPLKRPQPHKTLAPKVLMLE